MEQSPSSEANRSSATEEISWILWNQKFHHRIHKSPPLAPILSQIDPVHVSQTISRKSILILSSHLRLGLSSGLLSSVCRTKAQYVPLLPYLLYALPIFCGSFVTSLSLYGKELLVPRLTLKLEDHPLSAARDCLFSIFAATFHTRRPFLLPPPEDAPCHGDRDPLITVTETHLSL